MPPLPDVTSGYFDFHDKVVIVTGASTGLGPVMAKMFAAEGAKVVLAARRLDPIEKTAAEIGEAAAAIRTDVTQEADVAAMVETMPLERAAEAYAKMMSGDVRFRMVLTMV